MGIRSAIKNGDRTFLYDLNGNQAGWDSDKSGQKRRITWDEENRIQTITDGPTSEYKYDEDTNRVIKRRPGGETFYVNQFYVDAAGRNSKHVFAGTTRISTKLEMPSNGGGGFEKFQYFYHPDHLGSTSYVTDQLGQVDQHYETFPFGESWIEEATGQADKVTPYRFTGKEWDSETQLYYFGARYYDPRTSVWVSPDPIMGDYLNGNPNQGVFNPVKLALNTYAQNRPLILIDPNGLCESGHWSTSGGNARCLTVEQVPYWNRGPIRRFFGGVFGDTYAGAKALVTGSRYESNPLTNRGLSGSELQDAKMGAVLTFFAPGMSRVAGGVDDVARVTVFRVEGAANQRLSIEGGQVVVEGKSMLFLNAGQRSRAEEFLAKRLDQGMSDAKVKSFDVPESYLDKLRSTAVPESMASTSPKSPLLVDPSKAPDQYGLRKEQINELRDAIIQGSGKVE
ncbi:MAG: RHS repeat-associated core domain-containing protein [Hyphomicrobiaceae bacterium]|nr:RHS repeat-associated core domain-containing protein [Hyphomicrobiaceae bacterium]